MAKKATKTDKICSVTLCMTTMGNAWNPILLFYISKGVNRFTSLINTVEGINRQMLSKQLKAMEKTGVLSRETFAQIPPKVVYSLTPLGKSLLPVIQAMQRWGDKQQDDSKPTKKQEATDAPQQIGLFD